MNFDLPVGVELVKLSGVRDLFAEMGNADFADSNQIDILGKVFEQGGRMQFTAAITVEEYLRLVRDPKDTVAPKGAVLAVVDQKANRPTDPAHRKRLKEYLGDAVAEPDGRFILPNFTVNFGLPTGGFREEKVRIYYVGSGLEAGKPVPALAVFPFITPEDKMQVTDGAHRTRAFLDLLADNAKCRGQVVAEDAKERLRKTGVVFTVVFEGDMESAHQDFADCAKTKAITKDLSVAFDRRNVDNFTAREVIGASSFLKNRVDMTAQNINLRPNSKRLFTATGVKMFTQHVRVNLGDACTADCMAEFWDEAGERIDELRAAKADIGVMQDARRMMSCPVWYRAAACGLLARARVEAHLRGIDPIAVLTALNNIDARSLIEEPTEEELKAWRKDVQKVELDGGKIITTVTGFERNIPALINPIIKPMVSISDSRIKIASTVETLDQTWSNICQIIFSEPSRAAA